MVSRMWRKIRRGRRRREKKRDLLCLFVVLFLKVDFCCDWLEGFFSMFWFNRMYTHKILFVSLFWWIEKWYESRHLWNLWMEIQKDLRLESLLMTSECYLVLDWVSFFVRSFKFLWLDLKYYHHNQLGTSLWFLKWIVNCVWSHRILESKRKIE